MGPGNVDVLSTEMALGWASVRPSGAPAHVFAALDGEIIGNAVARIDRPDLEKARAAGRLNARAFAIVFERTVPVERVDAIRIFTMPEQTLARSEAHRFDRFPKLRVFVCGAPRSGTSQMGAALAQVLDLPWLGEGHAAPQFAAAARALQGDVNGPTDFVRFMAHAQYRAVAARAAKEAYFFKHGSASFIDKTPGVGMIDALPFLLECFADAHVIFLWRNPVANLLSRMVKFGGDFEGHCRDWAQAMQAWTRVRSRLPHYLEVRQEDMQAAPGKVGAALAAYLRRPGAAAGLGAALAGGALERTGAGLGKLSCGETDWTPQQIAIFERVCAPVFAAFSAGGAGTSGIDAVQSADYLGRGATEGNKMHFRVRGNTVQVVKATRDEATGKPVSRQVGSINLASGAIGDALRASLSAEEIAAVEAWLAKKQDIERRKRQLDAEIFSITVGNLVQWARESHVHEVAALSDEILFGLKDLQAAISAKLKEAV
jgi:hypothetical protein